MMILHVLNSAVIKKRMNCMTGVTAKKVKYSTNIHHHVITFSATGTNGL